MSLLSHYPLHIAAFALTLVSTMLCATVSEATLLFAPERSSWLDKQFLLSMVARTSCTFNTPVMKADIRPSQSPSPSHRQSSPEAEVEPLPPSNDEPDSPALGSQVDPPPSEQIEDPPTPFPKDDYPDNVWKPSDFGPEIVEIDKNWEKVKLQITYGRLTGNGPYHIGCATIDAIDAYTDRAEAHGCFGTLPLAVGPGEEERAAIYLWGEGGWVHAHTVSYIREQWRKIMRDTRHDDEDMEHRRKRWQLEAVLINNIMTFGNPITPILNRRSGQMGPVQFVPGPCVKEPDQMWCSGMAVFERGEPLARYAALEVVHQNESFHSAFFSGLLWSQQGYLPNEPVGRAPINALVVVVVDPDKHPMLCRDEKKPAFVIMLFTAADREGTGTIDVWYMNSTPTLHSQWSNVFEKYQPTLKENTIRVQGDVEEVNLSYRYFGPPQLVWAWQGETFKLDFQELAHTYASSLYAQQRNWEEDDE